VKTRAGRQCWPVARVLLRHGMHGRCVRRSSCMQWRRHDDVIIGGRRQLDPPYVDRSSFAVIRRRLGKYRPVPLPTFVGL
jgi:hypothetical protein